MADFPGTNFKIGRLERDVEKWQRREKRDGVKEKAKRAAEAAWRLISGQVRDRDKNTCRVCTCQTTKWGKGDPRLWGQAHHIVYRSAGGLDVMENLIWLCRLCHEREHKHELVITGTSSALSVRDAA